LKYGTLDQETQCYLTPRFVLRFLGTEAGRTFFFDTWVNLTLKIAKALLLDRWNDYRPERGLFQGAAAGNACGVVIPDVRWPAANEGNAIKAVGGSLWLVERPGTSQTGTAVAKHASETQPIPDEVFDRFIYNDCSLVALEQKVDATMIAMKEKS